MRFSLIIQEFQACGHFFSLAATIGHKMPPFLTPVSIVVLPETVPHCHLSVEISNQSTPGGSLSRHQLSRLGCRCWLSGLLWFQNTNPTKSEYRRCTCYWRAMVQVSHVSVPHNRYTVLSNQIQHVFFFLTSECGGQLCRHTCSGPAEVAAGG